MADPTTDAATRAQQRREDVARADGGHPPATKRALLGVSRSIESLAGHAAEADGTTAVVALFEDATYFAYERERYAALAERALVVVGFTGEAQLPPGIARIELPADHHLGDEWTVLLLSTVTSAGLVATDLGASVPETSLERGRLFVPAMSTEPAWVADQARRVVAAAGPHLDERAARDLRAAADHASDRQLLLPERILRDELLAGWWRTLTRAARLEKAEELALTDPLTHAYNRRFLAAYLDRLGPRAPDIAAVAFDFDGFKAVNDRFGHATGDAALRAFVDVVSRTVRATDVLVRMGGDEWLLLLPGVTLDAAVERAAAILAAYGSVQLPPPADGVVLRASAGVGSYPPMELDLDAVDGALYRAKAAGGGVVATVDGQGAATGGDGQHPVTCGEVSRG